MARKVVVPAKLAYPVPLINGLYILPSSWKQEEEFDNFDQQDIYPAFLPANFSSSFTEMYSTRKSRDCSQLIKKLSQVKVLEFERRTRDDNPRRIFGSVSKQDILLSLSEMDIHLDEEHVLLQDKIKDLGSFTIGIQLEESRMDLQIHVCDNSNHSQLKM